MPDNEPKHKFVRCVVPVGAHDKAVELAGTMNWTIPNAYTYLLTWLLLNVTIEQLVTLMVTNVGVSDLLEQIAKGSDINGD